MMINLNFDFTVANIVEFTLKRFTKDKGLLVPLKMSYDHWSNSGDGDYHVTKWVYMVFHRPDNYTRVFSLVSDKMIWDDKEFNKKIWSLECDHDSCWSSDGFSFIKKLKDEIVKEFNERFIDYNKIGELAYIEDIKHLAFEKYNYKGYEQRKVKLNFKIEES